MALIRATAGIRRRSLATAALLLALSVVTGCMPSPKPAGADADCGWLSPDAADTGPAKVSSSQVILLDRSGSFRSATPGTARARQVKAEIINQAVKDFATADRRVVSIGGFDGAGVTWAVDKKSLPPAVGTAGGRQKQDLKAIRSCLAPLVDDLLSAAAVTQGSDPVGAFLAAADTIDTAAGTKRITLLTGGLDNQGCGDVAVSANIARLVKRCSTQHALPQAAGISLTLMGLGEPGDVDQVPSTEQKSWLSDLWTALARQSGASFSADEVGLAVESGPDRSEGVDDPVVRVPFIPPPFFDKGYQRIPIPADLLFATNSAELSPGAAEILRQAVLPYLSRRYTRVNVVGHTDSRASDAYNQDLSERRADAVSSFLSGHGFSHVHSSGVGETHPVPQCRQVVDGVPNGSCMAANRRVDVNIKLVQEDS